jgi:hypothetical protein
MSNKPLPKGSKYHDASDPHCERHADAVRYKAIPVRPQRVCPFCDEHKQGGYTKAAVPQRKRRRATRMVVAA